MNERFYFIYFNWLLGFTRRGFNSLILNCCLHLTGLSSLPAYTSTPTTILGNPPASVQLIWFNSISAWQCHCRSPANIVHFKIIVCLLNIYSTLILGIWKHFVKLQRVWLKSGINIKPIHSAIQVSMVVARSLWLL